MKRLAVLVVDDDYVSRSIIAKLIKDFADVDVAVDGLDAVERISARNYDAAIVDLEMPMIDGMELIRILRTRESTKNIPIVVVSGNEKQRVSENALKHGASCVFRKPLDWTAFVPRLKLLLQQTSPAEPESTSDVRPARFGLRLPLRQQAPSRSDNRAPSTYRSVPAAVPSTPIPAAVSPRQNPSPDQSGNGNQNRLQAINRAIKR